MNTFWQFVGYIALGLLGLSAIGIAVLYYFAKMMDPKGGG